MVQEETASSTVTAPPEASVDDLRVIFSNDARLQYQLEVEAALAQSQAELGIIPEDAARSIAAHSEVRLLDSARMTDSQAETGHTLVPLIRELAILSGDPAGGWVHWGVTTQNVEQTAAVLALRDAHVVLTARLNSVLGRLADLADAYSDTPMAGRTHGQQAVPITFGFKVAAWIDALLRDLDRLDELAPRLYTCMMGGAVGTFATFGDKGPPLQAAVSRRLRLRSMELPSRTVADQFVEMVFVHGLIAATGWSIAEEVTRLMAVELGEVAEDIPAGDVGSSTMPQKRNPKLCQQIIRLAARQRSLFALSSEALVQAHEVDGARWAIANESATSSCVLLFDLLAALEKLVTNLHVHPERMSSNLGLTGGLINAEMVMMRLAPIIGRELAHHLVQEATSRALNLDLDGRTFASELAADPQVTALISANELRALLEPEAHLGLSGALAKATAARARERARRSPEPAELS